MKRRSFFASLVASLFALPRFTYATLLGGRPELSGAGTESEQDTEGFTPIQSPNRFQIVCIEWGPYGLAQRAHKLRWPRCYGGVVDALISETEYYKLLEAHGAAHDAHPNPDNLLAIPASPACDDECEDDPEELLTRDEAMETVAEWNQELLSEFGDAGRYIGEPWYVVVEHGKTRLKPLTTFEFGETGLGVERSQAETQIRLVRPTAAELARYVIADSAAV